MKFRPFSLECDCGCAPSGLKSVGLTPEHELVIHWTCPACGESMYAVNALAECWRDCPPAEQVLEPVPADVEEIRRADMEFLQSMRISLPGGSL